VKILFDQGVPAPLRAFLKNHIIETAYENSWQQLQNGELLNRAEFSGYDLFITTDQNLKYQQVLANRKISILVLSTTSWPKIRRQTIKVVEAVDRATMNSFEEIIFTD